MAPLEAGGKLVGALIALNKKGRLSITRTRNCWL